WRLAAPDTSQDQEDGESGITQPRDARYGAALFHVSILPGNARFYMEWAAHGNRASHPSREARAGGLRTKPPHHAKRVLGTPDQVMKCQSPLPYMRMSPLGTSLCYLPPFGP